MDVSRLLLRLALLITVVVATACTPGVTVPPGHQLGLERDLGLTSGTIRLHLLAPEDGTVIAGDSVEVPVEVDGYVIGGRQSVRVVLDDMPPVAQYDPARPVVFRGLSPGHHTVRAFLARPWGESIKQPTAFGAANFYVALTTDERADFKQCSLTLNSPAGTYVGDAAQRIMLDFLATGCKLSPAGTRVRYTLDDRSPADLGFSGPVWFEDLSDGEHHVALELIDRTGAPIPGLFGRAERSFVVNAAGSR